MPVIFDKKTGKYGIGLGKPIYKDKASADRAYKGYLGKKFGKKK